MSLNVTVPSWEQSWRKQLLSASQLRRTSQNVSSLSRRPWELVPNTDPNPRSLRGDLVRPSTAGSSVFDIVNKPATANPLDAAGLQSCVRSGGLSISKAEASRLIASSSRQRVANADADSFILRIHNRRRKLRRARQACKWLRPDAVGLNAEGNAVARASCEDSKRLNTEFWEVCVEMGDGSSTFDFISKVEFVMPEETFFPDDGRNNHEGLAMVTVEKEPFVLRVEGWCSVSIQIRVYGFNDDGAPERLAVDFMHELVDPLAGVGGQQLVRYIPPLGDGSNSGGSDAGNADEDIEELMMERALRKTLGWAEAEKVTEEHLGTEEEPQLRNLFDGMDEDGDGTLGRHEVEKLCAEINGRKLTTEELDEAMLDMDYDGDGAVTFDEFVAWWNKE
eukprot:SAG31_NODE_565_length_14056_cov_22.573189_6_plen_393_part_00